MRWLPVALLLAAASIGFAQTQSMYRTVGADGTVTFSDTPVNGNSERIAVLVHSRTPAATPETPAAPAATPPTLQAADAQRAAEIAANCTQAREHQQTVLNSTRLYRVLPDGERHFLSEQEVAQARENAATEVARWCESP